MTRMLKAKKNILRNFFVVGFMVQFLHVSISQPLTNSTSIQITKTWSQEPAGWTYPIFIHVPSGTVPQDGFPVLVALHGNGGNGSGTLNQYRNQLDCHIIVCPSGYQASWNICDENSDAPDIEMLSDLINQLQTYSNVNVNQIRLLGSSNGSALMNRAFIELQNSGIDMYVGIVSQLNVPQFHMGDFYGPSGVTDVNSSFCGYDSLHTVPIGVKYLSICNTNDPIIPYNGGTSVVGVDFIPAPVATHIIAESQGYAGSVITGTGTQIGSSTVYEYSYLNDQVVLLKGEAFHGLDSNQINYMVDFLGDCDLPTTLDQKKDEAELLIYPNPAEQFIYIELPDHHSSSNFSICDVYGRELKRGQLIRDGQPIDLSDFPTGLLIFHSGNKTSWIIKK